MHPTYVWCAAHYVIQDALAKLLRGELRTDAGKPCRRLMVLMPPQHSKSTLVSQLLPAYALASNPALKLLLLSYAAALAESHSMAARDVAHRCGRSFKLNEDAQARNDWRTEAGGYLVSAGIRGSVTGRAADGVIIDDPLKGDEEAMSPTIREKIWRNYSSVVETRLAPDGFVVLIGTPWHDEDLRGKLLEAEPDDWRVLRLPALWDGIGIDPIGRTEIDAPLWPDRYPLAWYLEKRKHLEDRGLIHQWHSLYQCRPQGDGTPREFAPYCPVPEYQDDVPGRLTILSCDPSKSKSDKVGDYAAFTLISVDQGLPPHLWVKSWALRTSANEVSSTAVALIEQYKPAAFAIETTMFQSLFYDRIFEAIKAKGLPCRMYSYTAPQNVDKRSKIRAMVGHLLQQKRLHLYASSPATKLFQQQLSNFPHDREHDDLPDALCMGMWCLDALGVRGIIN